MNRDPWAARMRRMRLAAAIHKLGPRPIAELVDEIARHHPDIADELDDRLLAYSRLDKETLRAVGGDRLPPVPMRAVR